MNTHRKIAIIVGIFFMFAVATLFIGEALYKPILNSPDYLDNVYPNRIRIIIGILLEFIGILGLVLIPVYLFPILKKYDEVLALGYVSFRLFEALLLSIAQVSKLLIINLSQDYLNKSKADTSYFQNMGNSIKSVLNWVNSDGLIYLFVFGIGALILYSVLYRSKLIPQWLSIWGFVAGVSIIIATLIHRFEISTELALVFMLPIAFQEQVMAIWLIVKGFNPNTITSKSL